MAVALLKPSIKQGHKVFLRRIKLFSIIRKLLSRLLNESWKMKFNRWVVIDLIFSHYRRKLYKIWQYKSLTVIAIGPPSDRTSKFIENSFQIPILQTFASHWRNTSLKAQSYKLCNIKHMITSTQITNTEIFTHCCSSFYVIEP